MTTEGRRADASPLESRRPGIQRQHSKCVKSFLCDLCASSEPCERAVNNRYLKYVTEFMKQST